MEYSFPLGSRNLQGIREAGSRQFLLYSSSLLGMSLFSPDWSQSPLALDSSYLWGKSGSRPNCLLDPCTCMSQPRSLALE